MKIHQHLVQEILDSIWLIFNSPYYAQKVIERSFKLHSQWGARDRRFFAENVYDLVRWWSYLWHLLEHEPQESKLWLFWGVYRVWKELDLPPWEVYNNFDISEIKYKIQQNKSYQDRLSFPDWMWKKGESELPLFWPELAKSLNQQASVYLRKNTLKNLEDSVFISKLLSEDISVLKVSDLSSGFKLKERKNVFVSKTFQAGYFEVQDGASQQIAPLLDVQPKMRVIDACAGAGGKTLHLAALMKNQGKIIALDINEKKISELKKRLRRAGVDIVEARLIDSQKVIKRLHQSADRLLLDVPCSGVGVLKRNPDTKWKLSIEEFIHLQSLQGEILENYSSMVKPGGKMLYSTCSVFPNENENQIKLFLNKNNKQWKLIEEKHWWPHQNDFDGFYAALLERIL